MTRPGASRRPVSPTVLDEFAGRLVDELDGAQIQDPAAPAAPPVGALDESAREVAILAGRFAGQHGLPITDCPYAVDGKPGERALAGAWVREFLRANPDARAQVDYRD